VGSFEIDETKRIVAKVEGFLTDEEGEILYKLAKDCLPNTVIVEVGSWKGKSTIWLSRGSQAGNNLKVFAVDPHTGSSEHNIGRKVWTFDKFKENILNAGVSDVVIPLVQTSEDASRSFAEPVGLIFIDGAHEYEKVNLDFELWFSKVKDGGIMAFHDTTNWPGPRKVVEEKLFNSPNFKRIRFVNSITYGRKCATKTYLEKLEDIIIFLIRNIYIKRVPGFRYAIDFLTALT
jgi:predicted O-methyltransferase YrrM